MKKSARLAEKKVHRIAALWLSFALTSIGCASGEATDSEHGPPRSESLTGGVALIPTADVEKTSVVGIGDTTSLYRDVDDGTAYSAADDGTTLVRSKLSVNYASHTVGYSGGPSGTVTDVVVHYRASRGSAVGTAQVELYDGPTKIRTGALNTLGSWANYTDKFSGLSVSNANNLKTKVILRNTGGTYSLRYTMIWIEVKATPAPGFSENFESFTAGETWTDGSTHGKWQSVYNGYGTNGVSLDGTKVLRERPKASTQAAETHAGLVTSIQQFGDQDFTVRAKTVAQLRTPAPNPWEVGWLLWHYTDDQHFYYIALKPNGWELGKEDPAYPGAQRYLATGASPTFPVGQWYALRVTQTGNKMTLAVNGASLVTFTDNERPYLSGSIGLYTEDAEAHFDDIAPATVSP